jgi:CheY-like chemotaxis protein
MSTPDKIAASSSNITPIAHPATTSHATRGTILVVEDDRSIRRYLEVILERSGYRVIAAADGLEAMKAALTYDLDAVVTDAIMPHLSGVELCRFLRHHPKLSRLPVVLLSGFERAAAAQETNDRPDVYLAKPVRPDDLVNCLGHLLLKAA